MTDLEKILVGIRNSKLSKAQTDNFMDQASALTEFNNHYALEIKTIKTTGDNNPTQRLDKIGGKGLFAKEIENEIISGHVDIGVHSMKDLPASEFMKELEIVCWLKRYDPHDVIISNSGIGIMDLPKGSVIGTSSIRRRSQVLKIRKDLNIKLLRGNVDTRIRKLYNNEYDAIILSLAGLQRLQKENIVTEVLDFNSFLPAACQGAVGIQAKKDSDFKTLFKDLNDQNTELECRAEREILRLINANCNSPVSVLAKVKNDDLSISFEILDHSGEVLFEKNIQSTKFKYKESCMLLSKEIIRAVGQKKINELDKLDDFNYTA